MLAATATLWLLFSAWLIGPHVGMARRATRLLGLALSAELVLLLVWSYGTDPCQSDTSCAPVAQAAGVAARTDLPLLAVVLLLYALRTTTARHMGGPSRTTAGSGTR